MRKIGILLSVCMAVVFVSSILLYYNCKLNAELISAASTGNLKDVQTALNHGANVNASSGRDSENFTPLMCAAQEDFDSILMVLLAHGADMQAQNGDGDTALLLAVRWNKTGARELLLQHGAESDPLRRAVILGDLKQVTTLLAAGYDVNRPDKNGSTPLLLAASLGRTEIVQLLLKHGAQVNKSSRMGHSPLYLAAEWGFTPIVKMLVAEGADITAKPRESQFSAQQIAEIYGHHDIAQLLQNASHPSNQVAPLMPLTRSSVPLCMNYLPALKEVSVTYEW